MSRLLVLVYRKRNCQTASTDSLDHDPIMINYIYKVVRWLIYHESSDFDIGIRIKPEANPSFGLPC